MVEVGVDRALLSEGLLKQMPGLRLVGVDPYPGTYNRIASDRRGDAMGSDKFYNISASKYAAFGKRAELIRLPSVLVARAWSVGPIDLVYIDAEHDYSSCRDDIIAWEPLVRPGGIIAGDDYGAASPGVSKAVHDQLPR